MSFQSRPEPMNASPHHSKVKVTLALSDPVYVSGTHISGKMQVESRVDLDSLLGIGVMMVELYAIQVVNSGEHSATSTFIHSRRIFQGPGIPPSNAVYSDYVPGTGDSPLPAHHYAARRGQTTFFFRFPLPASSPSSINFGPASLRYEVRASVSVAWRGDKRLVTDIREVKVVERWRQENTALPQAVVMTEDGKICARATLANDVVVGGEPACINLQLRNHTQRWTSGITVTLTRDLHLSASFLARKSPPNISDVTTQVEFHGPEYSVPPGVEGIARLVVDIPRHSRGVKGGLRIDDNGKTTEAFFEVRCTLKLRIDMPSASEDTVIILPLIIYHSLAVPASPPCLNSPPYSCPIPISPGLLSPPPGTKLIPVYTGNRMGQYDPMRPAPFARSVSSRSPNQHHEQEIHSWQGIPYSYAPLRQHSVSAEPALQALFSAPGLSTSHTSSPRLLPPPPTHVSYTSYIYSGLPIEAFDGYTSPELIQGVLTSPPSQNSHLSVHHLSLSPNLSSLSLAQGCPLPPGRARPPPIQIPLLPNPHDSQGIVHSPRPVPSPKHSFPGSLLKSNNVTELERMADKVGKQSGDLSLDLPKGDGGVDVQGPQAPNLDRQPDLSVDKTLPAPPVPSSKDRHPFAQLPRVDTLFTTEETMADHSAFPSSTDHLLRMPPTPPTAAITPIKFPKASAELSGLGTNLSKDVSPESGLDALERRLLAQVGTRRFDVGERPHVRSVVQPITIPPSGPPPDTVNDSAISSLTLADRDDFLKTNTEREQEQDRDSDDRTQHMGGGRHSPSEDDRDAHTQKGKSLRKLGKNKHSEEDLERAARRRERKRAKEGEGRKLRQVAKGRVAAWLGEIDISAPPVMDDPASYLSPTVSHFVPISESASFGPAPAEMTDNEADECRGGGIPTDKDVSASPNPRSSGFVTISSLNAVVATNGSDGETLPFKPCLRRSSISDFRQTPTSSPGRPTATHRPTRSPEGEAKPLQPSETESQPATQPTRLFAGHLSRFPPKLVDPGVKYDVRSARGGRGGKVTQVASLWAAKAKANAGTKAGDMTPVPPSAPKRPKVPTTPPAVRKPALNAFKRSPISMRPPPTIIGVGAVAPVNLNRVGLGETQTGIGLGMREVPRATKATTVPAVLSSSHAVPMLSSTASLARVKAHGQSQALGQGQARSLPPMVSETMSDVRGASRSGGGVKLAGSGGGNGGGPTRVLGDLAFGQARLRDLIKKYQG